MLHVPQYACSGVHLYGANFVKNVLKVDVERVTESVAKHVMMKRATS